MQGLVKVKDNEEPVCVDVVSATVIYSGYPIPSRGEDEAGWAISKTFQESGKTVWRTHWVNGTRAKSFIWDDRADYTYSQNID